tara:strand:- start:15842 stop:16624 length:783 start_codon:yes stop_codon:yes gene_type:complete
LDNYIDQLFNLKNKTVVIIGAGGHLCSEISIGFAKANCQLVLLDIRPKKLEIIRKNIQKKIKKEILTYKIDATKKNEHIKVIKLILKKLKSVDILVNGAGINDASPFFDIKNNKWNEVIDSQLTATLFGCQIFGRHMVDNRKGSIINISSASAGPPLSKAFAYSAAKSGIKNLTQNLGREWGTSGVRVNALRPGFFPTEWNKKNFIDAKRKKSILTHTPMNRFGKPNELIGATLWLASDASKFVTGTEIKVDGGFSCMTI